MTQPRILVVDDEQPMLHVIERILRNDFDIRCLPGGDHAIEVAAAFQPDIALIDIRMLPLDGFELMARLKRHWPGLIVILMTGDITALEFRLRAIREGALYFLPKPFERIELLTIVERCLEIVRLQRKERAYAERLESDLAAARDFHGSLLPGGSAELAGSRISVRHFSHDDVGGDFYDFAACGEGRVAAFVADVTGHGMQAAMMTGVLKSTFRAEQASGLDPLGFVQRVGAILEPFPPRFLVTMTSLRACPKEGWIEFANAGHPRGLLWRPDGEVEWIAASGPPIGSALPQDRWRRERRAFAPGSRVLLYSDAVTEAEDPTGEPYGEERLERLVLDAAVSGAPLLDEIVRALRRFTAGAPLNDDLTLLLLECGYGQAPATGGPEAP